MSNQVGITKSGYVGVLRHVGQQWEDAFDFCPHTENDTQAVKGYSWEKDSFGWLGVYCMCSECLEEAIKNRDEQLENCHYCGKEFPYKEIRFWKWYDFYAPQGDEPLQVCETCWDSARHQERLKEDRELRNSYYDDN